MILMRGEYGFRDQRKNGSLLVFPHLLVSSYIFVKFAQCIWNIYRYVKKHDIHFEPESILLSWLLTCI